MVKENKQPYNDSIEKRIHSQSEQIIFAELLKRAIEKGELDARIKEIAQEVVDDNMMQP